MGMCEYAYKKNGNDDTVRCKRLNPNADCCGNVKFCRMTGRWTNSDNYESCPIRRAGLEKKEGDWNGRRF